MNSLTSNSCNLIRKIFNFKSVICLCSLWILTSDGHTPQQEHELLLLDALGRRHTNNNNNNNYGDQNSLMDILGNSNSFSCLNLKCF